MGGRDDRYRTSVERNLCNAEDECRRHGNFRFMGKPDWLVKQVIGIRAEDHSYDERLKKISAKNSV
jgi:hypothetical protein